MQKISHENEVVIIGAGVVGVTAAYFLEQMGASVTIIDNSSEKQKCSYGNGGLIVPSHSIPLAKPGILLEAINGLRSKFKPFSCNLRLDRHMFSWLVRFFFSSTNKNVSKGLPLLKELATGSQELYVQIAKTEKIDFGYTRQGLLVVYNSPNLFRKASESLKLLSAVKIDGKLVSSEKVKQIEPSIKNTIGGIIYPEDTSLSPLDFVPKLSKVLKEKGVRFIEETEVLSLVRAKGKISRILTNSGCIKAHKVIIAAGAFSSLLARDLGMYLPIIPGQGHSLIHRKNKNSPKRCLILEDSNITVTPLASGTRYAGLLTLCDLNSKISLKKIQTIVAGVNYFLHDQVNLLQSNEVWAGFRPCTPDGIPIISKSLDYSNLFVASGHAMLGMTLGPMSGKLVAEMALDKDPCCLKKEPFSLQRF